MNSKLLALASILVATTAAASVAEAGGGGVRLGFGFPLGSFKATPSHGGGGYQAAKSKRKAPAQVHHAARKPEKSEPRVVKAEPSKPAKKVAAKAEKVEETTETTAPPLTGSSALIEQSIPAQDQAKPEPASEVKPEAATDGAVTASTDKTSETSETSESPDNCKKFIPAVGMTVSVGCGE